MKQRTRKFLAGLLSLGLLLQAASPLSALAADSGETADVPTLTVKYKNNTYTFTTDSSTWDSDKLPTGFPSVYYSERSADFQLGGIFSDDVEITGTGDSGLTIFSTAADGQSTVSGNLTVSGVQDVDIASHYKQTPVISGDANISCTGELNIRSTWATTLVAGALTVTGAKGINLYCSQGHAIGTTRTAAQLTLNNCTGTVSISGMLGALSSSNGTPSLVVNSSSKAAYYASFGGEDKFTRRKDAAACLPSTPLLIRIVFDPSTVALTLNGAKAYTDSYYTEKYVWPDVASSTDDTTTYNVVEGDPVYLLATEPDTDHQWHFKGWTGWTGTGTLEATKKLRIVMPETAQTLTAEWEQMHQIFVDGTAYTYNKESYFYPGQLVTLTAEKTDTDDTHYTFAGWTNNGTDSDFEYAENHTAADKTISIVMGSTDVKLSTNWTESYLVTVDDGCTLVNDESHSDSFYKANETVTVTVDAGKKVTYTPKDGTATDADKAADGTYTFTMPAMPVSVAAVTVEQPTDPDTPDPTPDPDPDPNPNPDPDPDPNPEPAKELGFTIGGTAATEGNLPEGLTYDAATGTLTVADNYTDDLAINVTQTGLKLNVNLQSVTGDVTLQGVNDVDITGTVTGKLTVGTADAPASGSVTLNGNVTGGAEINCAGNATLQNVNDVALTGTVTGKLTIGSADAPANGNVTITNGLVKGGAAIYCTGDVKGYTESSDGLLTGSSSDNPHIIHCGGEVYLENKNGPVTGSLKIESATNVTVKAGGSTSIDAIPGSADITCSGKVEIVGAANSYAIGDGNTLKYTPDPDGAYTVSLDGIGTNYPSGTYTATAAQPYGNTVGVLYHIKSILITPTGSTPAPGPDNSDDTPDDTVITSGSDAGLGGAVATVMVGGAAVWGGYQLATRVILHNLLPKGAAIPATRSELALLVWNAAGKPEPANAPAFADVADADTAKAAQWCVEQGLLDARTETTFKPDGLVTKVKVIEVWNNVFPKA